MTVRGEFPSDPEERVRIARTSNLFTKLLSTILTTENTTERRERFRAIETQLEIADALIRGDVGEVQRLLRDTLSQMGVTEEQMQQVEAELRRQIEAMGGELPPELRSLFGPSDGGDEPPPPPPADDTPLDDR